MDDTAARRLAVVSGQLVGKVSRVRGENGGEGSRETANAFAPGWRPGAPLPPAWAASPVAPLRARDLAAVYAT